MAKKTPELSEVAQRALEVLKTREGGATFNELAQEVEGLNPASLTALRRRGLIEGTEIEVEQTKVVKSKVLKYRVSDTVTDTGTAEADE